MVRLPRELPDGAERGFSLIEVLVATVIATVAVVGLAYTFGLGRSYIDRFETARAALAAAEARIETLVTSPTTSPDLIRDIEHSTPFVVGGKTLGVVRWWVQFVNDPSDGTYSDPNPDDLRKVFIEVEWAQGGVTDRVRLTRVLPAS